jgi:septin family protein
MGQSSPSASKQCAAPEGWENARSVFILVVGETGAGKSTLINTLWLWQTISFHGGEPPMNPTVVIPVNRCKVETCECKTREYEQHPSFLGTSSERSIEDEQESQTSAPRGYTFYLQLNDIYEDGTDFVKEEGAKIIVNILDTPGFGDTRSVKDPLIEQKNISLILQYVVEQRISKLDCLLYLFNGSVPRAGGVDKVIAATSQIFPRSFDNFRCLATNTGKSGLNANASHLLNFRGEELPAAKQYQYDNGLFKHFYPLLKKKPNVRNYNRQKYWRDDWDDDYFAVLDTLSSLFRDIIKHAPVKATQFHQISKANSKLTVTMEGLFNKIQNLIDHKILLEDAKKKEEEYNESLQRTQEVQQKYSKYIQEEQEDVKARHLVEQEKKLTDHKQRWEDMIKQQESKKARLEGEKEAYKPPTKYKKKEKSVSEQVATPYKNTMCLAKECHSTCHERCSLEEAVRVGDEVLKGCACMVNGTCKVCAHSYVNHHHVKYKWESRTIYEDVIDEEAMAEVKKKACAGYDEKIAKIAAKISQYNINKNEPVPPTPPPVSEILEKYSKELQKNEEETKAIEKQLQTTRESLIKVDNALITAQNEIEKLKTELESTFSLLSQLTYIKDFDMFLNRNISVWTDHRNTFLVTNPKYAQCTQMIEVLVSMMSEGARKDYTTRLEEQAKATTSAGVF